MGAYLSILALLALTSTIGATPQRTGGSFLDPTTSSKFTTCYTIQDYKGDSSQNDKGKLLQLPDLWIVQQDTDMKDWGDPVDPAQSRIWNSEQLDECECAKLVGNEAKTKFFGYDRNSKIEKNKSGRGSGRRSGGGAQRSGRRAPRSTPLGTTDRRAPAPRVPVGDKIVVSNLAKTVTDRDVQELFNHVGPVRSAQISFDATGKSKGIATVVFNRSGDAAVAVREYHNRTLDGRPMKIELVVKADAIDMALPTSNGRHSETSASNGRSSGGARRGAGRRRGGGRGGGPRSAPRPRKTPEELDAEMDAYMKDETMEDAQPAPETNGINDENICSRSHYPTALPVRRPNSQLSTTNVKQNLLLPAVEPISGRLNDQGSLGSAKTPFPAEKDDSNKNESDVKKKMDVNPVAPPLSVSKTEAKVKGTGKSHMTSETDADQKLKSMDQPKISQAKMTSNKNKEVHGAVSAESGDASEAKDPDRKPGKPSVLVQHEGKSNQVVQRPSSVPSSHNPSKQGGSTAQAEEDEEVVAAKSPSRAKNAEEDSTPQTEEDTQRSGNHEAGSSEEEEVDGDGDGDGDGDEELDENPGTAAAAAASSPAKSKQPSEKQDAKKVEEVKNPMVEEEEEGDDEDGDEDTKSGGEETDKKPDQTATEEDLGKELDAVIDEGKRKLENIGAHAPERPSKKPDTVAAQADVKKMDSGKKVDNDSPLADGDEDEEEENEDDAKPVNAQAEEKGEDSKPKTVDTEANGEGEDEEDEGEEGSTSNEKVENGGQDELSEDDQQPKQPSKPAEQPAGARKPKTPSAVDKTIISQPQHHEVATKPSHGSQDQRNKPVPASGDIKHDANAGKVTSQEEDSSALADSHFIPGHAHESPFPPRPAPA
ncbi:hypothetical protein HK104_009048, partial [Borealophlyctis nickersoniae]